MLSTTSYYSGIRTLAKACPGPGVHESIRRRQ